VETFRVSLLGPSCAIQSGPGRLWTMCASTWNAGGTMRLLGC
jgi:hypothetical protein